MSNFTKKIKNIILFILCLLVNLSQFHLIKKQLHLSKIWKTIEYDKHLFSLYYDSINWKYLCENLKIPIEFWEENFDKIEWKIFCSNRSIPIEFWENNINKLDDEKKLYLPYEFLPLSFIEKYLDILDNNWLARNSSIPLSFFKKHDLELYLNAIEELRIKYDFLEILSQDF